MSILLVEDNILNQRLMAINLKGLGHQVTIANNGAEGVEKYKLQKYDLILMDIMMPVMDGFEATSEIRKLENEHNSRNYTPIVAYTANTLNNDLQTCISKGMDHLLEKPFSINKFHEILDDLSYSSSEI